VKPWKPSLTAAHAANTTFIAAHAVALAAAVGFSLFVFAAALFAPRPGPSWVDGFANWPSLLAHSAVVCTVAVAVAVCAALPVAVLAFRTDLRVRRVVVAALLLFTVIPMYVSAGLAASLVDLSRFRGSALMAGVLYGAILIAPCALLIGIGLRQAGAACEEAALLDTSPARALWHVSLPAAGWSIVIAAILALYVTATDYFVTDLLQVRTFAEEVYTSFALLGSAGGPIFVALPAVLMFGAALAIAQLRRGASTLPDADIAPAQPLVLRLGRAQAVFCTLALAFLLVLGGVSLHSLMRPIESLGSFWDGFRAVRAELWTSAWTSAAAAGACAGLSVGIAWMMSRSPVRRLTQFALVALLALPGPVLAIGLIQLLNRTGLPGLVYDSPAMLVIAYILRFLPLAVLIVLPSVYRVPPELEAAARLDGARWFDVHRLIYWPSARREVRLAWFFVFVFCFGEVACSVLVAPPGHLTAGVRFFTLIHYGFYRDCAVICVVNILLVMIPWLLIAFGERFLRETQT
jgi:iron(III) transport system permease protein